MSPRTLTRSASLLFLASVVVVITASEVQRFVTCSGTLTVGRPATDPYARKEFTGAVLPMDNAGAVFEIDGRRQFHPVATAQSGLAALARGDLRGARIAAKALIANSTIIDGARMYPYGFAYVYDNHRLTPPWYSAMAQGQALSLLVRLVGLTDRQQLRTFADETYLGLNRLTVLEGGGSWADEYPVEPTNVVLNGAIWATFGRWDYWLVTGSGSQELCSAVESLRAALRVDARQSLYYDLRRHFYIPRGNIYRAIQMAQMEILYQMTSDSAFQVAQALLASDPP